MKRLIILLLLIITVQLSLGCTYPRRIEALEENQARIVDAVNAVTTKHNALVAELQKEEALKK
jgi:hypothetical protein